MAETTNYQLYVEDNDQTAFRDWRTKMNGPDESNMVKIDRALGEKAEKSRFFYGTLTASGWTGAPARQELHIPEMTAEQNGTISLSQRADEEQRMAAKLAQLSATGQSDGVLVMTADGVKPTVDLPVCVVFIG